MCPSLVCAGILAYLILYKFISVLYWQIYRRSLKHIKHSFVFMLWDYLFAIIWEVIKIFVCFHLLLSICLCCVLDLQKLKNVSFYYGLEVVFLASSFFTWLWQEIFRKAKKSQAVCRMPSLLVVCKKREKKNICSLQSTSDDLGHCKSVSTW